MNLPEPFQHWINTFEIDYTIDRVGWTNSSHRHLMCYLSRSGQSYCAKLALPGQPDQDEPDMLEGLRREYWWSQVMQVLRTLKYLPFRSPRVLKTNVTHEPFRDRVAFIIFERVIGQQIPLTDAGSVADPGGMAWFNHMLPKIIDALLALEKISPSLIQGLDLPELPSPPHGMRVWRERGRLEGTNAVLGNGAFELKNFQLDEEGELVIIDNEFAGWYPRYDSLSYCYHRLYCNGMQPDLAKVFLQAYLDKSFGPVLPDDCDGGESWSDYCRFFIEFRQLMIPRLCNGAYCDWRRRGIKPWQRQQRLRARLLWNLLLRQYNKLVADPCYL